MDISDKAARKPAVEVALGLKERTGQLCDFLLQEQLLAFGVRQRWHDAVNVLSNGKEADDMRRIGKNEQMRMRRTEQWTMSEQVMILFATIAQLLAGRTVRLGALIDLQLYHVEFF